MFEAMTGAVDAALDGFDPGSVPLCDAPGVWRELDRLERRLAGAKLLLADRVAASEEWRRAGHRSPAADLLADTIGEVRSWDERTRVPGRVASGA